MCRGWRFREPEVPGAIAPVPATSDMTQEVGIRNCRLYTKPGDAVVTEFEERLEDVEDAVDSLDTRVTALETTPATGVGYWGGKTTEEADSDSNYTFTSMGAEITDGSGKITIDSGKIKIGAGVSVIGLAASCSIASVAYDKALSFAIYKNGTWVYGASTVSGDSGSPWGETVYMPMILVGVTQNDLIEFKVSGANGCYATVKTTILILKE